MAIIKVEDLKRMFSWEERGNTLICSEDLDIRAWGEVSDNLYQVISFTWDNYPMLRVSIMEISPEELAKHIMRLYAGWKVYKCNLDDVKIEEGYVCEFEEG